MAVLRHPARLVALLSLVLATVLAGCASTPKAPPTWVPKPEYPAEAVPTPDLPAQPAPNPNRSPGSPSGPSQPSSGSKRDPYVVATRLNAPIGIAVLPDGSALVGERTGRIVRVQPAPGQPVTTVRTLTGLDTSGDGGLLDLALSPNFGEDGLIFAYLTTRTDNRVVHFTLHGPVTPVVTGIPKGKTGNVGRIAFDPNDHLLIGTGDAGVPASAANPKSLAGKVLRVDDIGHPAKNNPRPGSPIMSSGHHTVNGLCIDTATDAVYEVEASTSSTASAPSSHVAGDEVNRITAGANYGWPVPNKSSRGPVTELPIKYSGAAGCAVENRTLFVTAQDGKALLSAQLGGSSSSASVGSFTVALDGRYGRLRSVVAAPDGALWLTTTNKDGHGKPVPADERVIRLFVSGGGGTSPL